MKAGGSGPSFSEKPTIKQVGSDVIITVICVSQTRMTVDWFKDNALLNVSSRVLMNSTQTGEKHTLTLTIKVSYREERRKA